MRYLFLIFVITPVVEMWPLITVGNHPSTSHRQGCAVNCLYHINLLRAQGFETPCGGRKLEEGAIAAGSGDSRGNYSAVCGALLLTPGFVTDVIGFADWYRRSGTVQLVLSRTWWLPA